MKLISWIRQVKRAPQQPIKRQKTKHTTGPSVSDSIRASPMTFLSNVPRVIIMAMTKKQWTTRMLGLIALVSVIALMQTTVIQNGILDYVTDDVPLGNSGNDVPINSTTILVSPTPCKDEVSVVVIVTSHPGHQNLRNAWRRYSPADELSQVGIRRVFLLGQVNNQQLQVISGKTQDYPSTNQTLIDEEISTYDDIVQGSFLDAYRNLTLKHVMGLQWATTICPNASYVIKMDDDIAVDFYQLLSLVNATSPGEKKVQPQEDMLAGLLQVELDVVRDPLSKWFVRKMDYPRMSYPNFLSGWAYVASMSTAKRLVTSALAHEFFWIDDVLITGMIPHELGIPRQSISSYYSVYKEHLQCCVENDGKYSEKRVRKIWNPTDNFWCDYVAAPFGDDFDLLEKFLRHSRRCHETQKCRRRSSRSGVKTIKDSCVHVSQVRLLKEGKGEVFAVKV